jgi:hypothetical protein
LALGFALCLCLAQPCRGQRLANGSLAVTVDARDGSFQLATVLHARVGAEIDHQWVRSDQYPQRSAAESAFTDSLGEGRRIAVTCSGIAGKPDLVYTVQLYDRRPYATVQVEVQNHTGKAVTVQAIRGVEAITISGGYRAEYGGGVWTGAPLLGIQGPESADRVLSDSYSEDWPRLVIYDLGRAPGQVHRAAWSQVIYNRESKQSLFLGALSADRFVTLMHLSTTTTSEPSAKIASYTVDSTGTTELQREMSLRRAQPDEVIELSLPLADSQTLASERVMMATGPDYHSQLLAYGEAIRLLHHARVTAPNLLGWWSWTSYYMAINEGAALTNAQWMAENLKSLGYNYFHIDEGYQYARGEYATPNARLFPHGMAPIGDAIRRLGLTFGIWTAPFEVTNRAWVFENHKDWLVHTAAGKPISIGTDYGDTLYALDTTHPGAQEYLRQTYTTLTREWGVRYIKLDFMDTASIEGYRYKPATSALEAQRIGLDVIRKAVGEDVLLDKDGSPMLPPVGLVDAGRISADTAHNFQTTKAAASGIAARFYMNRNYYLNDPDAYNVGAEVPIARGRQGAGQGGLSVSEAQASIMLSAVSGGMYEIGDDLPILGPEKDRLDLVKNPDLLNMAKISRAATPVDLLSYDAEDGQPSVFFLREDARQSMLVVFNWTDQPRSHALKLADLGLPANRTFQASDVLNQGEAVAVNAGTVRLDDMARHSVRAIMLIDPAAPAAAPSIAAQVPAEARVSEVLAFSAQAKEDGVPALAYHWDFGDGTTADVPRATHAYTRAAEFTAQLTADGLDGIAARQSFTVKVTGTLVPAGDVLQNRRYVER